ncbi:MAG: winged helix-turn-helix domain-containing protein [Acidobacteriota bacterium]|nr:winged helix-turn-helix domain-containing protein [Acidobacteriota bacterium]
MRGDISLEEKCVYEFGNFRLNTAGRVLESAGRPISITPKALDVLIVLVENRGRIVEKEELIRKVWPGIFVEDNNLAFNISVLRKVFGESSTSPRFIETVPKRGYRFVAEVEEAHVDEKPARLSTAMNSPPPVHGTRKFSRPLTVVSALLILAAIGMLTYHFLRALHGTPKLTNKDTIVLADFLNKTGDAVFDGTLRQGLAVQLEQSPFLSLISDGRVRKTLRLMGQPADARMTPEIARKICERTGSAAVLEGSIASLGTKYVLGLSAENCSTGDILDEEQVQAARKEDVLDAVTQIASRFRTRAGESLATIQKHDTPFAEATTPSLEALKAYSAALKVHFSRGAAAALPLFRRAVEIDPQFAMAHSYLGRMYANLDESDLSVESIRTAWRLRDRVSDREKFAIDTRYEALVTGNLEETRQTAEAWTRTYPRDVQPHIAVANYYKARGDYEKAAAEARKAIELDPAFSIAYYDLGVEFAYLDRLGESGEVLRQAAGRGLEIDEFDMLRYDVAFLRREHAEMERVASRARERSGAENWIFNRQAFALAYAGQLQQARNMSRRAVDQTEQAGQRERAGLWEAGAALREAFFGNTAEARKTATLALEFSKDREVEYGAALALVLTGYSSRPQSLLNDLERRYPDDTSVRFSYVPVLRAQLALNSGDVPKVFELLQPGVPFELGTPGSSIHGLFGAFYPIYVRGEAYLASRRGSEAVAEFEKILDHRGIVISDPVAALARLQLGRAFSLAGDSVKAKIAYEDFLTLWKDADPDIPILKQAKAEYLKLARISHK